MYNLTVKLLTWNNITWILAGLTSVLVMLVRFVNLLEWSEHHQKVLAVTGKKLTCHLDTVSVVSPKPNDYLKYSTMVGSYTVHNFYLRIRVRC